MRPIERPTDDKALANHLRSTVHTLIELKDSRYGLSTQRATVMQLRAKELFASLPPDVATVTIAGVQLINPLLIMDKRKPNDFLEQMRKMHESGVIPTKQWSVQDINDYGHSFDSKEFRWEDVKDL